MKHKINIIKIALHYLIYKASPGIFYKILLDNYLLYVAKKKLEPAVETKVKKQKKLLTK